jgi:MoxR-like ATPase
MKPPEEVHSAILDEVNRVLVECDPIIEGITTALLAEGHVLLEGVPGVAKTTIANSVARAVGLDYKRVQMTPDILPVDITGSTIYREQTGEFEIKRGPLFTNVVLVDEINRATPKTQSALLEAMQERAVTIEGETLPLPSPFMIIATQNPVEIEGTFELPLAQRDRFLFKITVDLPERAAEQRMLERFDANPDLGPQSVQRVVTQEELERAREIAADVHVAELVTEYILDIVEATREHDRTEHGVSPRASLYLQRASKTRAAIRGRDYVIPDDVKAIAEWVIEPRLVLSPDANLAEVTGTEILSEILESIDSTDIEVPIDEQVS